jgi:hypothetical protein
VVVVVTVLVVVVAREAVETQPLTTACRSQSSSIALDTPCESVPLSLPPLFAERKREREKKTKTKQGADFWRREREREKKRGDKGVMSGKELYIDNVYIERESGFSQF